MTRICPACREENGPDARFCTSCGERFAAACPACGRPAGVADRFCAGCGQKLAPEATPAPPPPAPAAPEGERKQVTVLFADVARSMDLAEESDPEDWAKLMDRLFRALADGVVRFGGRVDKFTGDGIMALFGAPVSQEDHARRACAAALGLQAASADLGLDVRIGLNSGEVIAGGIGEGGNVAYTAVGHSVGLAQRMEGLAEPGSVFLTEHTARLVRGHFAVRDVGEVSVKGSAEPLRVFGLEGPARRTGGTGGGSVALIGRAEEMGALEAALARAQEGQAQVVGIAGEAGVGKSRLCAEFARSAAARGITVRRAAGVSHATDVPLLPVFELLRDYFGIMETDSRAEARQRISGRLLALDAAVEGDLPLLFDFLDVSEDAAPGPALSPEARLDRIYDLFRRVTQRRSDREALLFLLEDLHWFDAVSVAFVARIIPSFPGTRTMLLTNFRPEFSPPWAMHSYYRQLPLAPLDTDATARLLEALLGRDGSLAPLSSLIAEATGGSPFFVEEVVRTLVEDGTLRGEPGSYHLARPVESLAVPPTVQATLAARIDRLSGADKSVLQTAAVIGRHFTAPVLRLAVDRESTDLSGSLARLCAAEFAQAVPDGPVEEYRFWHPLTQEVAYRSLLRDRRAALHGAVARAVIATDPDRLDERAGLLATHFDRAGDPLEAARWNLRAGDFALRSSIDEAMRRWRTALDNLRSSPETVESVQLGLNLSGRLIRFLARRGGAADEARRLYEEVRVVAGKLPDTAPLAILTFAYGTVLAMEGEAREGLDMWRQAVRLGEQSADHEAQVGIGVLAAVASTWTGPVRLGLEAAARLRAGSGGDHNFAVRLFGYSPLSLVALAETQLLALSGRVDDARASLEALLTGPRRAIDAEWVAWGRSLAPRLARSEGEFTAGLALARQAADDMAAAGNWGIRVIALDGVAIAEIGLGRYADACATLESALAESRQRRTALMLEPELLALLAQARLGRADAGAALEAAAEAVNVAHRDGGRPVYECFALLTRARVLRATGGDPAAISADLDAALALARQTEASAYEAEIEAERRR